MITTNHNSKTRSGVSLIEVVMSTLLVGGILVVSLETLAAVHRTQRINASRLTGPGIARLMLTQGQSIPYENVVVQNGTKIPILLGWFYQIDVNWIDADTGTVAVSDTGMKQIHVTIFDSDDNETHLYALRSEDGGLEQTPVSNSTVVNWFNVELQLGTRGDLARSGAFLVNHAYDE